MGGRIRRWFCSLANWTFWPVVKAIILIFMVFVVVCVALILGWLARALWIALFD